MLIESHSMDIQALVALAYAASHFDIVIEPKQLQHKLGLPVEKIDDIAICRAARWIGMRSRKIVRQSINELESLPFPLLFWHGNAWFALTKMDAVNQQATIFLPQIGQLQQISYDQLTNIWHGEAILLAKLEQATKKIKFGFDWFIPLITKHRQQLLMIFIISMFLLCILLVTPMLFENIIDKVLVNRGIDSLNVLGIAMLALAIAEPFYTLVREWLFSNLSTRVSVELNTKLYRHLLALPLKYFTSRPTGQLIARIREMEYIRNFMTGSALILFIDLMCVVIFITIMLFYSVKLTGIVFFSLFCYLLFWLTIGKLLRKKVEHEYKTSADATSFLTESITGIETVKSTATENAFNQSWQQSLAHFVRASFNSAKMANIASQGIGFIHKMTAAALLWLGVRLALEGKLSPGELVAFNMFSGYVTQPILRLANIWQNFQHAQVSLKRIGTILETPAEPNTNGLVSDPHGGGTIGFKRVRFRYNPDLPEVLQNLNLEITAGEFIGITGPSGSGKSTLTKLLQRLYIPQHGQILVDGQDLAIIDPATLRRRMSVVLQESILFSGTIEDNIKQCRPDADENAVEAAARLAGAHDFITTLPQSYKTQVGEKGGMLSGGQRQRVALARALMANPQILILDEATSALDYESEAAIMQQLPEITRNRTVICIAHRLNTLQRCDRIVLLKDGCIEEQGTHKELIDLNGYYAYLWHLQTR